MLYLASQIAQHWRHRVLNICLSFVFFFLSFFQNCLTNTIRATQHTTHTIHATHLTDSQDSNSNFQDTNSRPGLADLQLAAMAQEEKKDATVDEES